MRKKALSVFLSLCLMLSSLPFTVLADENEVQEIMCTMDSECMAEVHINGCPFYSVPDTDAEPKQNNETQMPDDDPENPDLSRGGV